MSETRFILALAAAFLIFCWHVFFVMQLWTPESYLFDVDNDRSLEVDQGQHGLDGVPRLRSSDDLDESSLEEAQGYINQINDALDEYENEFDVDYDAERQHIQDQWNNINNAKERIGLD